MVSQREQLKEQLEDIQNYADTLEELKFNSKPHISTLTELARDYGKNRQAKDVIKIICDRILNKETPITHKMPTLYLLDSILKNHPDNYKDLIEKILVPAFECVFNHGDEKIRASMHKLRMTWTPWFYWQTLNDLDKKINKIDKAWPVIAKKDQVQPKNAAPPVQQPPPTAGLAERKKFREKLSNPSVENGQAVRPTKVADTKPPTTPGSGRPNIHVNPDFLASRQMSVSEDSQTEDDEIKAMEEKIQRLRRQKAEAAKKKEEDKKAKEKAQRKKELEAILEQERKELERLTEMNETEVSKITTSGLKASTSSKDSSLNSSSSSSTSSSTSSSSKASIAKVCFMVKAC